jgi:hypothetical protein
MNMTETNIKDLFLLVEKFGKVCDEEDLKLPYHINLIDELHADENAHSRILEKILKQTSLNGTHDLLENFVEYLKEKNRDSEFNRIQINKPQITQETARIDLWIRDDSYAIIIENKICWANDQANQIERYIEITKTEGFKENQIYVLYLPPTYEKDPEQQSWGKYYDSDIYNRRYLKLSFRDDIRSWLKEQVLPIIRIEDVYLRSAIEQYVDYLEGLFSLRTINNKKNMELQKLLRRELELDDNYPSSIKKLSEKKDELNKVLEQIDKITGEYHSSYYQEIEKRLKDDFPTLSLTSWETLQKKQRPKTVGVSIKCDDEIFQFEFQKDIYGITKANENGKLLPPGQLPSKLETVIQSHGFRKSMGWCGWKEFKNYDDLKNLINEVLKIYPHSPSG